MQTTCICNLEKFDISSIALLMKGNAEKVFIPNSNFIHFSKEKESSVESNAITFHSLLGFIQKNDLIIYIHMCTYIKLPYIHTH